MSAHTPGPWEVSCGSVYGANDIRIALMDREELCTLPAERDANARLIAAAPRMLAALTEIAQLHRHHDVSRAKEIARAILRDVEGESNGT